MHQQRFAWDRLTVTCVLSFCLLVAGLSVGIVLGELREELGLSGVLAAAHGSMFGVGLLAVGTVGLRAVHRVGRTLAFRAGCGAIVTGVLLLSVGRAWPVTLLGATISGFACALLVMLMPGIVADHHGEHRATAFAAINGLPGLAGITFSVVVGSVISAGGSWRWPFALLTVGLAVVTIVVGRGVALPESRTAPVPVLPLFRRPEVRTPYFHAVHAVMVEFPVGIWAVSYLKEVGGASSGAAASLGAVWGLCLFASRMLLPRMLRTFGGWSRSVGFAMTAIGAVLMWSGPGLTVRVLGLVVVGMGAGPLYPLAVDRLYARDGADTISLGAITALASGTAVTIGPIALGLLADGVGLRHALLFVPALALLGIWTSRPVRPVRLAGGVAPDALVAAGPAGVAVGTDAREPGPFAVSP